jgi:hypothetical protein
MYIIYILHTVKTFCSPSGAGKSAHKTKIGKMTRTRDNLTRAFQAHDALVPSEVIKVVHGGRKLARKEKTGPTSSTPPALPGPGPQDSHQEGTEHVEADEVIVGEVGTARVLLTRGIV